MMTKDQLRRLYLRKRRDLSIEQKKVWDNRIFETLMGFTPFQQAQCIMTYLSFDNEVDTIRLVKRLFEQGKRVVVPQTDPATNTIEPGEIFNLGEDLAKGPFNILEPVPERFRPVNVREIGLHIVPGVVFDLKGDRIGFSRGFYDRFLVTVPSEVPIIGLSFECQLVESIPADQWDMRVKYLVTEKRIVTCCEESGDE